MSCGAISILNKTAERVRKFKRQAKHKQSLEQRAGFPSLEDDSALKALNCTFDTKASYTPFKFESAARRPKTQISGSFSVKRGNSAMTKGPSKIRPVSAHVRNKRLKQQQESDKSLLMNEHLHIGGAVKPMSALLTIDLNSKLYCRTLKELKDYKPTSQRDINIKLKSSRYTRPKLSSRNSILCTSCTNRESIPETNKENSYLNISKAHCHPGYWFSSRNLPPKVPKAVAETQTSLAMSPVSVFDILEDDEVESPLNFFPVIV